MLQFVYLRKYYAAPIGYFSNVNQYSSFIKKISLVASVNHNLKWIKKKRKKLKLSSDKFFTKQINKKKCN